MKKIFTNGVFDLFHEGHFNLLRKAKAEADYLLVGVNSDESCGLYKRFPFQPCKDRIARIREIPFVDEVIETPFSDDLSEEFYLTNQITAQIQGDRSTHFFSAEKLGILKIVGRTPGISTTKLLDILHQKNSLVLEQGYLNEVKKVSFEGKNYIIKYGHRVKAKKYPVSLPDSRIKNEYEVIMSFRELCMEPSFITKPICSDKRELIIFDCAPDEFRTLYEILAQDLVPDEAQLLSIIRNLAQMHNQTYCLDDLCKRFADNAGYQKIKIGLQCFGASQDSELQAPIKNFMDESLKRKQVLLHGDFDPKNILVHGNKHIFIDFEESGYGDPALDVGYLLAHLYLHKQRSKYKSQWASLLNRLFKEYCIYFKGSADDLELESRVVKYIGLFLLSRIEGILAPAHYVLTEERPILREIAIRALLGNSSIEIVR